MGSDRALRVDVRVVAATNRDLEAEVAAGRFRADLFHRLDVYRLRVPSLRDRADDIPLLAGWFADATHLRLGTGPVRWTASARATLRRGTWPGNVRELENVVSRAVLRASAEVPRGAPVVLEVRHLTDAPPAGDARPAPPPAPVHAPLAGRTLREATEDYQRAAVRAAVAGHGGNWAAAARDLGMHRSNLHHLARRLGLRERTP